MVDNTRLAELYGRWVRDEATAEEMAELMAALPHQDIVQVLGEQMMAQWKAADRASEMPPKGWAVMAHAIATRYPAQQEEAAIVPVHRVHFLKTAWFRYAAAVLLLITGIALYYNFSRTSKPDNEVVQTTPPAAPRDVMPGFNRAVLTLSDGRQVALDSAASETIEDGTLSIENTHGQLIYTNDGIVAMNSMTTPKGGQYQLTLADGTKVWLNAASSITYPTAFKGNTREVSVSGEVYFEVAKNARKPFRVKTGIQMIEVLGTHFNVNAYADEAAVKTTLLEGAVRVVSGSKQLQLSPGEEALQSTDTFIKNRIPHPEGATAWMRGAFNFDNTDLRMAMRQFARWYDIEVSYTNDPSTKKISGEIGRDLNLTEVMRGLKGMGVQTQLEGRKLIVTVK